VDPAPLRLGPGHGHPRQAILLSTEIIPLSIIVTAISDIGFVTKYLNYIEYHSVCPLLGIGTPPLPLPQASVPFSPNQRGGGRHIRLRVRGWGSPNSDDARKNLALCLLCRFHQFYQLFSVNGFFSCTVLNSSIALSVCIKSTKYYT
jgi:hypothetical protein